VDSATALRLGAAFEALLIEPMLAPLVTRGAFGEYGAGLIAEAIAERDSRGFGALVARRLGFDHERP
jgi:hypothetical protein